MAKGRGPNSKSKKRFNAPTPPNTSRQVFSSSPSGLEPEVPFEIPLNLVDSELSKTNQGLLSPSRKSTLKSKSFDQNKSEYVVFESQQFENNKRSSFLFKTPSTSPEPSIPPGNTSERNDSPLGNRKNTKKTNSPRPKKNKSTTPISLGSTTSKESQHVEKHSNQNFAKDTKTNLAENISNPPANFRARGFSISEQTLGTPGSVNSTTMHTQGGWANDYNSLSFWDYFKAELGASEYDPDHEVKRERLANFFKVPQEFEKLMFFGFCVCLNSVLYNFTILPTRIIVALLALFCRPFSGKRLNSNQVCDLLRGSLIFISCFALSYLDLSKLYHAVRGQSVVKLYVIFNMLENFDRLAASLGQDLLSSFFADMTLEHPGRLRPIYQFLAASFYIPLHTAVLFYQMMALNVSVNSYNDALLSLLMSNQFVEIKGSVFKKFERENLFQLTCSDITERFQLTLFLAAITLRNISAIIGSVTSEGFSRAVLPTSFRRLLPSSVATGMDLLLSPAVLVLMCEVLVDWAKHSFVTKFNHIRPSVYNRYLDLLCKDIVSSTGRTSQQTLADQSPAVARRLGLSVLPLTCLIIRVILQLFDFRITKLSAALYSSVRALVQLRSSLQGSWSFRGSLSIYSLLDTNTLLWILSALLIFVSLTIIKLLLGLHILKFAASRHTGMVEREAADVIASQEDIKQNFKELNNIKQQLASSEAEDIYRPKNLNLNTIDRFSLFKSRVP